MIVICPRCSAANRLDAGRTRDEPVVRQVRQRLARRQAGPDRRCGIRTLHLAQRASGRRRLLGRLVRPVPRDGAAVRAGGASIERRGDPRQGRQRRQPAWHRRDSPFAASRPWSSFATARRSSARRAPCRRRRSSPGSRRQASPHSAHSVITDGPSGRPSHNAPPPTEAKRMAAIGFVGASGLMGHGIALATCWPAATAAPDGAPQPRARGGPARRRRAARPQRRPSSPSAARSCSSCVTGTPLQVEPAVEGPQGLLRSAKPGLVDRRLLDQRTRIDDTAARALHPKPA